ncbi:DUF1450 domain-containing protein [Paenibacillus contaminans]|uniref:DUF1450 domain-containing protein n=1 Tax=Paenibacillus contaminans TaxID=450362 RepID=A0A329M4J4_9BACL|nr:DUF1450 domain-containing protein [Paenibacillus contaminans]RAV14871.1 hypothetical protein DQG23_31055 [Paenibacillus contaminans]
MGVQITCCINNLSQHQYGEQLNRLAAEGAKIQVERCLSQCVGCRRQPSFMAHGKWFWVDSCEEIVEAAYTYGRKPAERS